MCVKLGLDSFVTGNKANVSHLLNHDAFDLLCHDVRSPIKLDVDRIYHLACPAAPPQYQADPIKTFQTAVIGTMNMLELARFIID